MSPVGPDLDYRLFDADNHYYEAKDAFTRHLDPRHASRTVQWAEVDGRQYHLVGGRISHAVKNPTFNPIAMPGVLHDYLRGDAKKTSVGELLKQRIKFLFLLSGDDNFARC